MFEVALQDFSIPLKRSKVKYTSQIKKNHAI